MADDILKLLRGQRFNLSNEKTLQLEMETFFKSKNLEFRREYHLDEKSIIDFMFGNVGVEVKIKGSKMSIYKQCERYCTFHEIDRLILVTNKSVKLPLNINDKQCYVFNLSKSWL